MFSQGISEITKLANKNWLQTIVKHLHYSQKRKTERWLDLIFAEPMESCGLFIPMMVFPRKITGCWWWVPFKQRTKSHSNVGWMLKRGLPCPSKRFTGQTKSCKSQHHLPKDGFIVEGCRRNDTNRWISLFYASFQVQFLQDCQYVVYLQDSYQVLSQTVSWF